MSAPSAVAAREDPAPLCAPARALLPAAGPFGVLLFALALAPRLYVALAWSGEPVWDGHYYDFGARRIAQGFGYSDDLAIAGQTAWHAWCHYPVGYSAFLAIFYRLFGASLLVAAVTNAVVGALLAVVTYALARRALSEARARVAGAIVAFHPGLVLYAALVMTEPLAALFTMTAFWLTVRDTRPMRGIVVGALVLGVGALVRPQALLCAPFFALAAGAPGAWPAWARRLSDPTAPLRGSFLVRVRARGLPFVGRAALACAIALVPVLPWTLRNCRVMDGCALVSTNGGWNLAIGAFPRATGRFETLRASDGCREVTGQVQQDRCWFAYGAAQIREHPLHWLGLIPAKLGYTFDHESFAVEYLREARPGDWPEARRVGGRGLLTAVHRLLMLAAVFGAIAFPSRGAAGRFQAGLCAAAVLLAYFAFGDAPLFWPLAVFISLVPWIPLPGRPAWNAALLLPVALLGTTVVTHAAFFGEDRYHVVVVPVLALLAAAALRPGAGAGAEQKKTARAPE